MGLLGSGAFWGGVAKGAMDTTKFLDEKELRDIQVQAIKDRQAALKNEKAIWDEAENPVVSVDDFLPSKESTGAPKSQPAAEPPKPISMPKSTQADLLTDAEGTTEVTSATPETLDPTSKVETVQADTSLRTSAPKNVVIPKDLSIPEDKPLLTKAKDAVSGVVSSVKDTVSDVLGIKKDTPVDPRTAVKPGYGVKSGPISRATMYDKLARNWAGVDSEKAEAYRQKARNEVATQVFTGVLDQDMTSLNAAMKMPGMPSHIEVVGFNGDKILIKNNLEKNGQTREVDQFNILSRAMAHIDPKLAAGMVTTDKRTSEKLEQLKVQMQTSYEKAIAQGNAQLAKQILANQGALERQIAANDGRSAGRSGSGTGTGGTGKGDKGPTNIFGNPIIPETGLGSVDTQKLGKDVSEFLKENPVPMPEGNAPAITNADMHGVMMKFAPGMAARGYPDAMARSYKLATEYLSTPPEKRKFAPYYDNSTGRIYTSFVSKTPDENTGANEAYLVGHEPRGSFDHLFQPANDKDPVDVQRNRLKARNFKIALDQFQDRIRKGGDLDKAAADFDRKVVIPLEADANARGLNFPDIYRGKSLLSIMGGRSTQLTAEQKLENLRRLNPGADEASLRSLAGMQEKKPTNNKTTRAANIVRAIPQGLGHIIDTAIPVADQINKNLDSTAIAAPKRAIKGAYDWLTEEEDKLELVPK